MNSTPGWRVAERVRSGAYGTVMVIAALGVTTVADIGLGYSAELVLGVGGATWIAHLYAELLGRRLIETGPMRSVEIRETAVDGSPILLATLLPAIVLAIGRSGVLSHEAARIWAMVVAVVQLVGIGIVVARCSPSRSRSGWFFAVATGAIGMAVGLVVVLLGH